MIYPYIQIECSELSAELARHSEDHCSTLLLLWRPEREWASATLIECRMHIQPLLLDDLIRIKMCFTRLNRL